VRRIQIDKVLDAIWLHSRQRHYQDALNFWMKIDFFMRYFSFFGWLFVYCYGNRKLKNRNRKLKNRRKEGEELS
jgi:hypothetical protein